MIDSLTVSVLLFVALAIGAVVIWDAWRAWRLRKLAVQPRTSDVPAREDTYQAKAQEPLVPGQVESAIAARTEPSWELDGAAPSEQRLEPALSQLSQPASVDASSPQPIPTQSELLASEVPGLSTEADATPYLDPAPVASVSQEEDHIALGALASSGLPLSAALAAPSRDSAMAQAQVGAGRDSPLITSKTDCIAVLRFVQPIAVERVVGLAQSFRRSGSKPVAFEVAVSSAESSADVEANWVTPRAGTLCSAARFGLLLANRLGPLNALEYSDFAQKAREIATSLGVGVDIPDMASTLASARELDAESAQLDATICLNIDAGEVLGPSQLASLAGPLAVSERGNNRYARLGPRGETLFSVSLGERSNRLSFLLDLPRVDPSAQAFPAMLECARIAARRLPGRLVDDEGRTLSDRAIDQIARGIESRQQALQLAGLQAGSPAALRVFN